MVLKLLLKMNNPCRKKNRKVQNVRKIEFFSNFDSNINDNRNGKRNQKCRSRSNISWKSFRNCQLDNHSIVVHYLIETWSKFSNFVVVVVITFTVIIINKMIVQTKWSYIKLMLLKMFVKNPVILKKRNKII